MLDFFECPKLLGFVFGSLSFPLSVNISSFCGLSLVFKLCFTQPEMSAVCLVVQHRHVHLHGLMTNHETRRRGDDVYA